MEISVTLWGPLRKRFCKALSKYIKDTFDSIDRVRDFCGNFPKWMDRRQKELKKIKKLQLNTDSRSTEVSDVFKNILIGLRELDRFLDALEKLAVTSEHVFTANQVLNLPDDINAHVQTVIIAARHICPLLLEFKRDANVFFLPKLQNADIMVYQLQRYIQVSKNICKRLEKSCISDLSPMVKKEVPVYLDVGLPFNDIQKMLRHVDQLEEIRNNQDFRMLFLFQDVSCSHFISEFRKRQPTMLRFLTELERCAVQLDRMNKGAKFSSVIGSSVGAAGGVLSIAGLALMPSLTTAMGITCAINSAVTTFTEIGVKNKYQNNANEVFNSFMSEVESLQKCLGQVISQPATKIKNTHAMAVAYGLKDVGSVGYGIHSLSKDAFDGKLIANKGAIVHGGKAVVKPGKGALKRALTMFNSQPARNALNHISLCMSIYSICKDSIILAKGSETDVSQFIRARAALWKSEVDSWKKMHDSLHRSQSSF
ncbi:uncharacterized protein LOC133422598 [Cololabis saira]|uniref:uncharacterized protein LOC133422598 n=1 Tax=Cololabis saira TaxID=129043 RepID=UPI002AD4A425|nr:uncharacterized protein LOC133422598 [Cololabis saira]